MDTEITTMDPNLRHSLRLLALLDGYISRSTEIQLSVLESQSAALQAISNLSGMPQAAQDEQAVFSRQQLEEFASGSIARCFGPEYAILDQRPAPRIPNRRLLLIDRVKAISGIRKQINPPASIVTEVDVPRDAWYMQGKPYDGLPLAILMEMALQPCGILSAYLGTSLVIPLENYLFRNLDGRISLNAHPVLRGKTITNRAELTKSVASGGLYIQNYQFALSVSGNVFLEGESSFGYFTPTVMKNQSGLDLGAKRMRLVDQPGFTEEFHQIDGTPLASVSLLDLTEKTWINQTGGKHGPGVVAGQRNVNPADWFFANHFHGDPVMPGSLGVEAVTRGLAEMAGQMSSNRQFTSLKLDLPANQPLRWKYRGQVLPSNQTTYFEAHAREVTSDPAGMRITADADFWVDDLRIYSIENLSLLMKEGMR